MSEHHDHSHAVVTEENSKKLMVALGLTTTFLIVEVVAAFITQSLALLSDAAHMFTDVAALAIALAAIKIGKKAADDKRTFGYQRFEILAALFNAVMLFVVAIYIVYEAYQRFTNPAEIQSVGMMIVAVIGLVINLISINHFLTTQYQSHQEPLQAKYGYFVLIKPKFEVKPRSQLTQRLRYQPTSTG